MVCCGLVKQVCCNTAACNMQVTLLTALLRASKIKRRCCVSVTLWKLAEFERTLQEFGILQSQVCDREHAQCCNKPCHVSFHSTMTCTSCTFKILLSDQCLIRLRCRCIIDRKQRTFDAESCRLLCNFAEVVVREIEKNDARVSSHSVPATWQSAPCHCTIQPLLQLHCRQLCTKTITCTTVQATQSVSHCPVHHRVPVAASPVCLLSGHVLDASTCSRPIKYVCAKVSYGSCGFIRKQMQFQCVLSSPSFSFGSPQQIGTGAIHAVLLLECVCA